MQLPEFDLAAVALLAFVTLQRLAELVYARANERRLAAVGGEEHGAAHYPLIVGVHALWLAGLWALAIGIAPSWPWVALFFVLQLLRVWVLATLGPRWTTRIIVVPGEHLVARGPYRWLRHPNYAVVAGEIFVLPMAFGLTAFAIVFSALNALVLAVRIGAEDAALRAAAK